LDLAAGFSVGSSNNGNLASFVGTGQQAFNRAYSYDSLNRLSTMTDSASGQSCKGLSWTYDAWANRTAQNNTSGTCYTFLASVGTNNQFGSPYTYDAAGNMTYDGTNTYYYDAENRLIQVNGTLGTCSTATVCYAYDALGRRVYKSGAAISNPVSYVYDVSGKVMAVYNPTWATGYVYLAGQLLAEYQASTTYFVFSDHLGSSRVLTGVNQSVAQNLDYYPFGQLNSTDSGVTTIEFTGDEYDTETGVEHTQFRQYAPAQGRWLTPDPAGFSAVDPTNPQSWNRYTYALNNPLRFLDPSGLTCFALDADGNVTNDVTDPSIDNAKDCEDSGDYGGVWVEVDTTVVVTADNSGDLTGTTYWQASDDWGYLDSGAFTWTGQGQSSATWLTAKIFAQGFVDEWNNGCVAEFFRAASEPLHIAHQGFEAAGEIGGGLIGVSQAAGSLANQLYPMLPSQGVGPKLDPFLGPIVISGLRTVASTASKWGLAAEEAAAEYVPVVLAGTVTASSAWGFGREMYAMVTGECH
jgi:RHS repeat-associated protein